MFHGTGNTGKVQNWAGPGKMAKYRENAEKYRKIQMIKII